LVDFGATSTTFTVLRDNKLAYSRDFNFGGQQLTESIMRSYGLTIEEAGRAKKEGGLPGNYQSDVLDPFIDDMNQQVIRARQFYMAAGNDREQPEKILVCGGCSSIPGVADLMASRIGIAAEKADPLGQITVTPLARSQGAQREANSLIVALGLALRNFD
jgi:type IV pilus assembly protein PilM